MIEIWKGQWLFSKDWNNIWVEIKMVYENLLYRFTEMSIEILKTNLVGIYLHGSAALGCFNSDKSDLDLIVVVKSDISDEIKLEFLNKIVEYNREAPAKGIELSIVKRKFCKPFVYPTPFELHFSNIHLNWFKDSPKDYVEKMNGIDYDLAAHFTMIKKCGIVLYGEGIDEVFAEVEKEFYIDSICRDIEEAKEDILDNPVYIILNLCRVLAYLKEDLILSKKSGGEWGMKVSPQKYRSIIQEALQSYESSDDMVVDLDIAVEFAEYMLGEIENMGGTYHN